MTNTIANRDSFTPSATQDSTRFIRGTIECTIGDETRILKATKDNEDGRIWVYGFSCRYRTGKRDWPAQIVSWPSGNEGMSGGFDSRSGRHHLLNAISFAEERRA